MARLTVDVWRRPRLRRFKLDAEEVSLHLSGAQTNAVLVPRLGGMPQAVLLLSR
jgi:hypothetical protein